MVVAMKPVYLLPAEFLFRNIIFRNLLGWQHLLQSLAGGIADFMTLFDCITVAVKGGLHFLSCLALGNGGFKFTVCIHDLFLGRIPLILKLVVYRPEFFRLGRGDVHFRCQECHLFTSEAVSPAFFAPRTGLGSDRNKCRKQHGCR